MLNWKQWTLRFSVRDGLLSLLPALTLGLLGVWVVYRFVDPAPPTRIVISTGDEDSEYVDFANAYKVLLKLDGIDLVIRPSRGAMDNLSKLRDPASDVDVGFMQAGIGGANTDNSTSTTDVDLVSLGSLSYEPIWVFYRGKQTLTRLSELTGKRIAIGATATGTHALVNRLLMASEVTPNTAHLVEAGHDDAQALLLKGAVDAAFFIGAPDSTLVQLLATQPQIRIMNMDQAEAYSRHFPYLHHLVLPHGTLDMAHNLPATDLHLLTTTTVLVARESLHPALAMLLLKAMMKVHDDADLLNKANEFPSVKDLDLPLSDEAAHFYKSGPPLLQRYLPFWLATWVDRMALALIPVLAVLIPVFKTAPRLYEWRIRRRIYRWYGELRFIETQVRKLEPGAPRDAIVKQVDQIEERVSHAVLPLAFADHVYVLKEHIDFVRRKM